MRKYDIKEFAIVPPPYGGVSVYVRRLIKQLSRDGYKVGAFYEQSCVDYSIKCSPLYDKWLWMQTILLPIKLWRYLRIVAPYKIVHSHFSLEGMAYLWFIKFFGRKKIIITIHNSMILNYYSSTNVVNRFFLKKMLRSDNIVWITVSEQGKQQLLKLPVKPYTPVHVIPPYVPEIEEEQKPLPSNMQEFLDGHDKNIAFYGHCFMRNGGRDVYGFKTIIKLYSRISKISDIGLVLCLSDNNDPDGLFDLKEYSKDLGVLDKIYWQIGAIDNIRLLWKEVDVYVRPTSTDGDSVAVREALDEGTVVVASDVCDRPQGVVLYKYGNDDNLYEVVKSNLNKKRSIGGPNMGYYIMMKDIYDKELNK